MAQWKRIKRKTTFVRAPSVLHRETSLTRGIIRDVFSTKIESVQVDSRQVFNEIVEYLKGIAPELVERIHLYEGNVPLFDKADIETEIRDLFKRRCDLPSGGYLIIEPTEALVSIDVNSGRFTGQEGPRKDDPQDQPRGGARSRAAAPPPRRGRHHRLRLHRHGDAGATATACCRRCARTWAATGRAEPAHSR